MAGSFNPETNGLDMNNLIEALQTIMDAAQGLRNFNNEVSDSTRQVTSNKKAAQDMFRGLAKNATDAGRELDRTAKELKRINDALPYIVKNTMSTIEKNFAFTSQELNRNFKLDKWMNPVFNEYRILQKKSVKEFEDQLEDIETALASVTDEVERASLKYQKDLIEERKEHVKNKNEWQLMASDNAEYWKTQVIKAGKKVLGDLYNFAKSKINSAVSSYASTMQSTYTTIQSYNNYTEKQYNQMFKRLQKSIDDAGLNNIININELQQQYTGAIQGGLTGKNAETNAYYAQIAKQAGVTFDWNDSNWLKTYSRMSKQGNDMEKLSQDIIVATENMMEAAGNGFAFTNGQINSMVDSLNQLQGSLNLTDEAYLAAYKSFGTAGSMLNEWGIDATKIYADITEYATKGITSGATAKLLNMGGLTQAEAERKIEAGETDDIVIKYLTELQNRYDKTTGEFVNVASSALNESLSTEEIQAYQEYVKYLSDNNLTVEEEFARIYDYDKWAYDKMIKSLENSETGQDKMQNTLDNIFDEIGKFTAMHPILTQIAQSVMTVAEMAAIGYFMGGTDSTGGRTIQTLLNKIFGTGTKAGGGGILSNANAATSLYKSGASFSEVASVGGKGTAVLGKAGQLFSNGSSFGAGGSKLANIGKFTSSTGARFLGGAGGALMIGSDIISASKNGKSAGESLLAGITGVTDTPDSVGDIVSSTLKNTGKGAMIGNAILPGWGAAIGAGVGAIASLTHSIIEYNDEQNVLNRNLKKFDKTIESLNNTSETRKNAEKEVLSLEELYSSALNGNSDAIAQLNKKYPILNQYMTDAGTANEDYEAVLKEVIKLEQQKIAGTSLGTYNTSYNVEGSEIRAGDIWKDGGDSGTAATVSKNLTSSKSTLDAYTKGYSFKYKGEKITFDDKDKKYDPYNDILKIAEDNGIDLNDIGINTSNAGQVYYWADKVGIMSASEAIEHTNKYAQEITGCTYSDEDYARDSKAVEDAHKSGVKDAETKYKNAIKSIKSWHDAVISPSDYSLYYNSFDSWAQVLTQDSNAKATFDRSASMFKALDKNKDYFEEATGKKWEDFKSSYSDVTPLDFYKKFNEDAKFGYKPPFAVGTTGDSTIPYDNYLAYLHKGEQVRTAAEVAVERAEQHVASSNAIGQLNSAVMQQTNTIINLLTQILSVTTSLAGRVGAKPAQSYDYRPVSI